MGAASGCRFDERTMDVAVYVLLFGHSELAKTREYLSFPWPWLEPVSIILILPETVDMTANMFMCRDKNP